MKDARVYSTLAGAKKCAKELKRLFGSSGFILPLNKRQSAVARGIGPLLNVHRGRTALPLLEPDTLTAGHRRLDASKIASWTSRNPDWPERLKATIIEPALFAQTVNVMAHAIGNPAS